jgi:Uma2 family endonuclease
LDGNLIMSHSGNSYAFLDLGSMLRSAAREAGYRAYGSLNVLFHRQRWIQPDLTILRQPLKRENWVPIELVLMPIEFVSPSSGHQDRIDKPALCAAAGVPYYMWVEITDHEAHVDLLRLDDSGEYVVQAKALAGQEFRTDLPFPLSFDPEVLLES